MEVMWLLVVGGAAVVVGAVIVVGVVDDTWVVPADSVRGSAVGIPGATEVTGAVVISVAKDEVSFPGVVVAPGAADILGAVVVPVTVVVSGMTAIK